MHWSMVAAFIVAMWTRDSELERMIHVYAGYAMAGVLAMRIIYGFAAHDLAAFRRFPPSLIKGLKYTVAQIIPGPQSSGSPGDLRNARTGPGNQHHRLPGIPV